MLAFLKFGLMVSLLPNKVGMLNTLKELILLMLYSKDSADLYKEDTYLPLLSLDNFNAHNVDQILAFSDCH